MTEDRGQGSVRIERIGDATLYLGDCLEVMPMLGRVDAAIFSPPYLDRRDYGGNIFCWSRAADLMALLPCDSATHVLVNVGLVTKAGSPFEYWRGLFDGPIPWRAWYVWDQGFGYPGNHGMRLAPSFEFIFHFTHDGPPARKVVPSLLAGQNRSRTGARNRDGSVQVSRRGITKVNDFKAPDSVLRITREMQRNYDHPAMYPVALPLLLADTYSVESGTILDPFMGSGTTGVACAQLGRKFIGIELDPKYFDITCRRIEEAQRQGRLFEEPRPKAVQEALI